jgi:hypothetical protein
LRRTECCGLTIERSDGAISTHVFQNSIPTHTTTPFPVDAETMQRAIFEIVSGFDSQGEWFVNCYRKTTKGSMHSRQLCCGGLPL